MFIGLLDLTHMPDSRYEKENDSLAKRISPKAQTIVEGIKSRALNIMPSSWNVKYIYPDNAPKENPLSKSAIGVMTQPIIDVPHKKTII